MKNISLQRYSPTDNDHLLMAQLVECYREVFADQPWNEWLRCSRCQKYWGIKDRGLLVSYKFLHCGLPLIDFWPREQVISDLFHEITPEASCWLAINDQKVIGFCWGYPITIDSLEVKLGITLKNHFSGKASGIVAYQDEVGVISEYRGRKIAKTMVMRRLEDFLARGLTIGVVRTKQKPEPSQTFLWYTKKLGYKILTSYPTDDGRVILIRELAGLKEVLAI